MHDSAVKREHRQSQNSPHLARDRWSLGLQLHQPELVLWIAIGRDETC